MFSFYTKNAFFMISNDIFSFAHSINSIEKHHQLSSSTLLFSIQSLVSTKPICLWIFDKYLFEFDNFLLFNSSFRILWYINLVWTGRGYEIKSYLLLFGNQSFNWIVDVVKLKTHAFPFATELFTSFSLQYILKRWRNFMFISINWYLWPLWPYATSTKLVEHDRFFWSSVLNQCVEKLIANHLSMGVYSARCI